MGVLIGKHPVTESENIKCCGHFKGVHYVTIQERQCTYNIILRRVPETTFAVEKR